MPSFLDHDSKAQLVAAGLDPDRAEREIRTARAAALRYSAQALRETGEANTHDAALLLEQLAEEIQPHA